MNLVKVRNVGDRTYTLFHAIHGDSVIRPGAEAIVHLEVALVALGNPAAENRGPAAPDRHRDAEVKRIQTLWGFYSGLHSDDGWAGLGFDKTTGDECGPFMPALEVYDLDGDRIWMVHDDPAGEHRSAAIADRIVDVTSGRAVENELAALQEQVRHLTDILAAQTAARNVGPSDPASTEGKLAAAVADDGTQAQRNATRFDIPAATPDAPVATDKPRTTRSGSRVAAG